YALTSGSIATASGWLKFFPFTVNVAMQSSCAAHDDVAAGAVLRYVAEIGNSGSTSRTGVSCTSHRNRCRPAFVESDCSGRIQYLGILSRFGFASTSTSALEYFRTDWPLASLISIVTGPRASFERK